MSIKHTLLSSSSLHYSLLFFFFLFWGATKSIYCFLIFLILFLVFRSKLSNCTTTSSSSMSDVIVLFSACFVTGYLHASRISNISPSRNINKRVTYYAVFSIHLRNGMTKWISKIYQHNILTSCSNSYFHINKYIKLRHYFFSFFLVTAGSKISSQSHLLWIFDSWFNSLGNFLYIELWIYITSFPMEWWSGDSTS